MSADKGVVDRTFCIDPTTFRKSAAYFEGMTDVGKQFLDYQIASTATVNDLTVKASVDNMAKFL